MRGERSDHSLQATALLNEAYLRLIDVRRVNWQNRVHFLAMTARIMRRILVDAARARGTQRRGSGASRISLDDGLVVSAAPNVDLIALNEALDELGYVDPRKSRVVELRYFGGSPSRRRQKRSQFHLKRSRGIGVSPRPGCERNWNRCECEPRCWWPVPPRKTVLKRLCARCVATDGARSTCR